MIRVLIVEDSPVTRALLEQVLNSDPGLCVVGTAGNGAEALELIRTRRPDIVTMDIQMPVMDGCEATRRIMERHPLPVVIVSASGSAGEVDKTFRALEAGAVAVVEKPAGPGHPDHAGAARKLVQTIKLMAEVKVVRRWTRHRQGEVRPGRVIKETETVIRCVAVGASTGGPQTLKTILSALPADFAAPLLIVQHIAAGFLPGLVEWLRQSSSLPLHIASHGAHLLDGHVFFAPDGYFLVVTGGGRIDLRRGQPEDGLCPSVAHLFRSVAEVFGPRAAAVLLTGMGSDGARELKLLREKGAVTIAQDKDSSVVYGMPGEAVKLGAAAYVLPPGRIAGTLAKLVCKGEGQL
ncbi:MAG: chemotaxis-specific protein-glutamate methyltransferase CheB [Peptococcaceae bacterium]|nr:chemotaxis-specific protein-glutamate methyltransferase CheB [Peptococcaceae bacterium]